MAKILYIMQSEGRLILKEGVAASREAIDVVMVNGFGFPRWRGGPMYMCSAEKDARVATLERDTSLMPTTTCAQQGGETPST